jgi:hypothetical protein
MITGGTTWDRAVVSEAINQPTLAPYAADGSRSANIIHPAVAAGTTAASRCSGVSVSVPVAQKGFTGAAML